MPPLIGGGTSGFRTGQDRSALAPSFRALSEGVFSAASKRESRLEGVVFAFVAALAIWPIALAVQAAIVLLK